MPHLYHRYGIKHEQWTRVVLVLVVKREITSAEELCIDLVKVKGCALKIIISSCKDTIKQTKNISSTQNICHICWQCQGQRYEPTIPHNYYFFELNCLVLVGSRNIFKVYTQKRIHIKEYFILQRIVIATNVLKLLRGHVVQAKYIVLYRRDNTEQLGNRYGDLSLSYMERGT